MVLPNLRQILCLFDIKRKSKDVLFLILSLMSSPLFLADVEVLLFQLECVYILFWQMCMKVKSWHSWILNVLNKAIPKAVTLIRFVRAHRVQNGNIAHILLKTPHLFLQVSQIEGVGSGSGHKCTEAFRRHPARSCATEGLGRNNPWCRPWRCHDWSGTA